MTVSQITESSHDEQIRGDRLKSKTTSTSQHCTEVPSLPPIVVRDNLGRILHTDSRYQRIINQARWKVAHRTRDTEIGPEEWRLPHGPLPARPDFSRQGPLLGAGVCSVTAAPTDLLLHEQPPQLAHCKPQASKNLEPPPHGYAQPGYYNLSTGEFHPGKTTEDRNRLPKLRHTSNPLSDLLVSFPCFPVLSEKSYTVQKVKGSCLPIVKKTPVKAKCSECSVLKESWQFSMKTTKEKKAKNFMDLFCDHSPTGSLFLLQGR